MKEIAENTVIGLGILLAFAGLLAVLWWVADGIVDQDVQRYCQRLECSGNAPGQCPLPPYCEQTSG